MENSKDSASHQLIDVPSSSKQNTSRSQWWLKIIIAAIVVISVTALLTALAALTLELKDHQSNYPEEWDNHPEYKAEEQQALIKISRELTHEHNNNNMRTTRSTECSSPLDPTRATKPTAHITGNSFGKKKITNINMIVSNGWTCITSSFFHAHVAGGMSYNKTSGFIKVPVTGYYNVYSQMYFEPTEKRSTPIRMGHKTVLCNCATTCSCSSLDAEAGQIKTSKSKPVIQSSSSQTMGTSKYHGGVFKLEANSYIGLVPTVRSASPFGTRYSFISYDSFFGAFLISEISPPTTPSPTVASLPPNTTSTPCTC